MRDRILQDLDVGPSGAALRVALGAAFVALVRAFLPGAGLGSAVLLLCALLFGVKVFAAVARRAVRASDSVRTHWEWRRHLAQYHDSYQWRKLTWVGAGILAVALLSGGRGRWELELGAGCVLSGLVAEAAWRRKGLSLAPHVRG